MLRKLTRRINHMAKALKVGDFYTTSNSNVKGIVSDIYANNGRKVVEMQTLEGSRFSTLPRGIRAVATA